MCTKWDGDEGKMLEGESLQARGGSEGRVTLL